MEKLVKSILSSKLLVEIVLGCKDAQVVEVAKCSSKPEVVEAEAKVLQVVDIEVVRVLLVLHILCTWVGLIL